MCCKSVIWLVGNFKIYRGVWSLLWYADSASHEGMVNGGGHSGGAGDDSHGDIGSGGASMGLEWAEAPLWAAQPPNKSGKSLPMPERRGEREGNGV